MNFSIAICDDDYNSCLKIKELLSEYEIRYDFEFEIFIFTNPEKFLESYHQPYIYDIIFLDVEMNELSGLEVAHKIRNIPDTDTKIIFVSNYPEYMQDSFNVSAFQYLQKPMTREQLHKQFYRILEELQKTSSNSIIIRHDDIEEVVPLSQIIYIENLKGQKRLNFVCKNKVIPGYGLLNKLEEQLKRKAFYSPHRGLLVNMLYVHYIRRNEIELSTGIRLPLSRRREKEFRYHFNKQLLQ